MDETRGPWMLEALAEMTGGQHHMVRNIAELPTIAARMSLSLYEGSAAFGTTVTCSDMLFEHAGFAASQSN